MKALLLDFGGVLTPPVGDVFASFESEESLPPGTLLQALVGAYGADGGDSDIARIERGELPVEAFEARLSARFAAAGHDIPAERLVERMFAGLLPTGRLWDATRRLRDRGVATVLLSNSWSMEGYPNDLLDAHFDAQVFSGAVGLRKPDAEIYHLAVSAAGVDASACVFVDDLQANVDAAERLGIAGVLHDGDEDAVLARLSTLFDVDLADAQPLDADRA